MLEISVAAHAPGSCRNLERRTVIDYDEPEFENANRSNRPVVVPGTKVPAVRRGSIDSLLVASLPD